MIPAHTIQITTPKRYLLNGLWFGPRRPRRTVIWVHGLGSSLWSKHSIISKLVDKRTAVLVFNNRGHDKVVHISHASGTFGKALRGGSAHERFVDCVDDIQGAVNFAKRQGAKEIFLVGHSTGCQKSVYWANKKGQGVRGIALLAPISDYTAIRKEYGEKKIARALSVARSYIRRGKGGELLPPSVWGWPWIADAQRFVSLYSGESSEEIFTYWNRKKNPKTLAGVRTPLLVLLAARDEYADRPAREIGNWFEKHLRMGRVVVIPRVKHSFKGAEHAVAHTIRRWMKECA